MDLHLASICIEMRSGSDEIESCSSKHVPIEANMIYNIVLGGVHDRSEGEEGTVDRRGQ